MIDIIIACMYKSEEYLYICILTLLKLAKNKDRIRILVGVDLNQSSDLPMRCKKIKELSSTIEIYPFTSGEIRGSLSHAMTLNYLYGKSSQRYCMIFDADIAIVRNNWDDILLKEMEKNNLATIGVDYGDNRHYANFPCMMACMIDTDKAKDIIDFLPIIDDKRRRPIDVLVNKKNRDIYKLPLKRKVKMDTGIRFYHDFVKTKLKSQIIKSVPRKKSVFLKTNSNFPGQEYHHESIPFILHHDNSSREDNPHPSINLQTKLWIEEIINWVQNHENIDLSELRNILLKNWLDQE